MRNARKSGEKQLNHGGAESAEKKVIARRPLRTILLDIGLQISDEILFYIGPHKMTEHLEIGTLSRNYPDMIYCAKIGH